MPLQTTVRCSYSKGQLISKWFFGVVDFLQKTSKVELVFLEEIDHATVVGLLLEVGREAFCEDIQI